MSLPGRTALPQAFFLPTGAGQRFCLFHPAQGDARRGCVLYLHPFAEELNCTRRVVARQARALASAGFGVLQIDLLGCGDSAGDFADATWPAWLSDAQQTHRWLTGHCGGPLWLWGMRSGALLAAQLARLLQNESEPAHLLFWQPVASGQQMLQQFLRLRTAGQWLSAHPADERQPAQALAQGQTIDIAGYTLSPALAHGLGEARLQPPPLPLPYPGRLVWLEVSTQEVPALSPAADKPLTAWRAAGWQVQAQAVSGPAFWQTVGTDDAPDLIHATLAALAPLAPVAPLASTPPP
ncbi:MULTISPECIES: hydrolase 2, exosortase A system-associated [unclassified Acidovorax]|uniref:hydrolase 2, exosortase A system-associated n=1 Tax=unclassified Acidovorax TaxID=2684926 RepID=UPI000B40162A|nr:MULTISPECIES: hydrolase 2, exosortase A system-associated [unclassified Acidovorax]